MAIRHPFTKHQLELLFVQFFGEKHPCLVELDIFRFTRMNLSIGLNTEATRLGCTEAALIFQLCSIP